MQQEQVLQGQLEAHAARADVARPGKPTSPPYNAATVLLACIGAGYGVGFTHVEVGFAPSRVRVGSENSLTLTVAAA